MKIKVLKQANCEGPKLLSLDEVKKAPGVYERVDGYNGSNTYFSLSNGIFGFVALGDIVYWESALNLGESAKFILSTRKIVLSNE